MTSGFPNLFLMPCPGQQAVVTVNYTLLAEVGAEFVAATIAALDADGVDAFDVTEEAEADWVQQVMTASMASAPPPGGVPCTPGSRMLFDDDGNMVLLDPARGHVRRRLRRLLRLPRSAHRVARRAATSPDSPSSARRRPEPCRGRSTRAAHQRARSGVGELAVVDDGLAGDERGHVAVGALDQATGAGGRSVTRSG